MPIRSDKDNAVWQQAQTDALHAREEVDRQQYREQSWFTIAAFAVIGIIVLWVSL